jgi:CPA2 family monovalent cation:H+ antiporter-2
LRKYQLPEPEIETIVKRLRDWGYSRFIRSGNNGRVMPGMDTVLLSLRIHILTVEEGSSAEGKSIEDLGLETRYGITDFGLRRDNTTTTSPAPETLLKAGDGLLVFVTDQMADELARCFSVQKEH